MEKIIKPSPVLLMGKGGLSATVDAPSATLRATPMSRPKPPGQNRFIDQNFQLAKVSAKVGNVAANIWDFLELLLSRKRQPA